jgi:hypothetical protein
MWRDTISGLFSDATFAAPSTVADIESAEEELKVAFPDELRALLLETNGVAAHYGSALVWSVPLIVANNQLFRDDPDFALLYMSFTSLLFFGDAGNGDQFGYRVLGGQVRDTSWIFKWDHESDNREWYAFNLADFFRRTAPTEP